MRQKRSKLAKQTGLPAIMMFLAIGAVILGVAGLTQSQIGDVLGDVRVDLQDTNATGQLVDTYASNNTVTALDGMSNLGDRNSTVGSIVGIVVVIALLLGIVALVRGRQP